MADKTYKMTVTLSDGNTVDAGTFVAPQGPAGSAINWSEYKQASDFSFPVDEYGVYLIDQKSTLSNQHNISIVVVTQDNIETGGIFFKENYGGYVINTYYFDNGILGINETTIGFPDSVTPINLTGSSRLLEPAQLTGYRFAYAKLISF